MRRRGAALVALLAALLTPLPAAAQPRGPQSVGAAAATLSVLQPRVERVTAAGAKTRATDGMTLAAGDRVITSGNGIALVTFLDGSTITVQPGSDVVVRRLEGGGRRTGILVNAGAVWARVARVLGPGPGFSLESNTATAAVHDGVIGAQYDGGLFQCWTQRGELRVSDASGRPVATLKPGEMTTIGAGRVPQTQPFSVTAMTLRIHASGGVWPLVEMPAVPLLAGFVSPGVEVNQVYGSITRVDADGSRLVEVPAGLPGPYTVRLQGASAGPFTVTMTGTHYGSEVYRLQFSGTIGREEWLWTGVQQDMQVRGGFGLPDYRSAKAAGVRAASFGAMRGDLPGVILLSPREVGAPR
jgi:hypothetical protein